jgi:phenylacetate-CoA ligase
LHVCAPTHFVEIIGSDGSAVKPGELGEIIVTSLANFAMPLIRYRIGDMGMWAETQCNCGRNWPLLKEVVGRTTDVFRKADGGIVPPQFITQLIHVELNNPWLRKFQVIQEDYNRILFLIVTSKLPDTYLSLDVIINPVCKKIQMVMGNSCKVEYKVVNDIPPSPSGKYRYTISKLM